MSGFTDNLAIAEVATNQVNAPLVISTALNALDDATQNPLDITYVSNARTLTTTEFTRNYCFIGGNLTATGTLTVPNTARQFGVWNTSGTYDVEVTNGGSTALIGPESFNVIYTDGTNCALGKVDGDFDFVVGANPFFNTGTVETGGTLTAATIAAQSLIGNKDSVGAVPTGLSIGTQFTINSGGTFAFASTIDLSGATEVKVPTPSNSADAATKAYVDAAVPSSIGDKTILSNIAGSSAAPAANTLTAILDDILSNSQGAVIVRGATAWEAITAGTSGYALVSQGTSTVPQWSAVSGGGGGVTAVIGNTGSVTLAELVAGGVAPLASPDFTGTATVVALNMTGTLAAFPVSGNSIAINTGSVQVGGTLAYNATASATITLVPTAGVKDIIVSMPSGGGACTVDLNSGNAYGEWKVHFKQGATASTLSLTSKFIYATSGGPSSFTLTGTANQRDILWMENLDGTHAVIGAVLQGITI